MKLYAVKMESFKCMFKCIITNVYTMLQFLALSSFPPCAGAIQRWGIPVETTRKPYSSCQGECVQDEQQPRTEKEQFVSIGTTVFLFCVLFVLEASDPVNCQASCKKSTIGEQT